MLAENRVLFLRLLKGNSAKEFQAMLNEHRNYLQMQYRYKTGASFCLSSFCFIEIIFSNCC